MADAGEPVFIGRETEEVETDEGEAGDVEGFGGGFFAEDFLRTGFGIGSSCEVDKGEREGHMVVDQLDGFAFAGFKGGAEDFEVVDQ
jgi:hypothetical protein